MIRPAIFMSLIAASLTASAQTVIPLYPGKVPNSIPSGIPEVKETRADGIAYSKVSEPTLEIFLPEKEKATGAAVVICPGGGYAMLAYTKEGTSVAKEFNKMGVAAFVLKYRLPADQIMKDKTIGPLQDAQEAIKVVRQRAAEWNIDTGKVGIMGFSAGGHLASTAGTHFNKAVIDNKENINLRPDFMILGYPVISMTDSLTHKGSQHNLLGENPSPGNVTLFSNEKQVSPQTPPTFIFQAEDDKTVKVKNSLYFYESLLRNKVPAEMHIYPKGGHGFGLNNPTTPDKWIDRLENWMKSNGWAN